MSQPLVSVLVITYNQARYITETVESAASQDYDALEVIVADDGSTDETPEVLAGLERKYPGRVLLAHGPNQGIPRNFNRGLAKVRGDLVAILGGDDLFLPGKVKKQVEWFAADARRVLCGHDAYTFDSDSGKKLRRYTDLSGWTSGGEGPEVFIAQRCQYFPSSIMMRRSAMPARGFDVRISTCADEKMFIECLYGGGSWGHLPEVLGMYRRHSHNITSLSGDRVFADLFVILGLIEAEQPQYFTACRRGRARLHIRSGLDALHAGKVDDARSHLLNALRTCPEYSWKLVAWLGLTWSPRRLSAALLEWLERRAVGVGQEEAD